MSSSHTPLIPCSRPNKLVMQKNLVKKDIPTLQDLAVEITGKCFQTCKLCYGDFNIQKKEMTLEQLQRLKSEMLKNNVRQVHLTGGEPLMHSHFAEIVAMFDKDNFSIEMDTNAVLINEKITALIKKANIEVNIGVESIDRDVYRWYRGTPNLEQVLKTIDILQKQNTPLLIHLIVADFIGLQNNKYDAVENIVKTAAYFTSRGIDVYLIQYRPQGRALKTSKDVIPLTAKKIQQLYTKLTKLSPKQVTHLYGDISFIKLLKKRDIKEFDYYGCLGGLSYANVTYTGDVIMCYLMSNVVFGNIFKESLVEIIKKIKDYRFQKLAQTKKCNLRDCVYFENHRCYGPCLVSNFYKEQQKTPMYA